jgi:hypothetical protein
MFVSFSLFFVLSNSNTYAGNGYCPFGLKWGISPKKLTSKGINHDKVENKGNVVVIHNYKNKQEIYGVKTCYNGFLFVDNKLAMVYSFNHKDNEYTIYKGLVKEFGEETYSREFYNEKDFCVYVHGWDLEETKIEKVSEFNAENNIFCVLFADRELASKIKE